MYVIYKVYLNERVSDEQFPKLKRFFKKEIVESGMDNPHKELVKWLANKDKVGVTYSIGIDKEGK